MYRVILIDDEKLIRDGLKALIDWEALGFCVIDEAENGIEAESLVLKVCPDLILVDIKMPGLDGISLIKSLRYKGFKGKIIILTGYADFEYAKQAVSLDVISYIIKPIDENDLVEILNETRTKLDKDLTLEKLQNEQIKMSERDQIRARLFDKDYNPKNDFTKEDLFYKSNQIYHVIMITFSKHIEFEEYKSVEKLLHQLSNIRYLKHEEKFIVISKNKSIRQLQVSLSNFIIKYQNLDVFITVGRQVKGDHYIRKSYLDAKNLSTKGFLYREKNPVFWDEYNLDHTKDSVVIDAGYLYDLVEVGNNDAISVYFNQMEEQMIYSMIDVDKIKGICVHCFITAKEKLITNYSKVEEILKSNETIIDHIYSAKTLHEIILYMEESFLLASETVCDGSTENTIKRILNYIHNNYYRSLRLEFLARLFNYNSSYLGKLFKEKTGDNFNLYLDKVRVEHAKVLIETSDYKVYEVAEKVGYSSVDYFYTKFKKHVGISPNAYKKKEHH